MAEYEFKFPDVGEGITEGEVVKWKVKIGDKVKENQIIAEVETDKAVVEIPSPKEGKVLKLNIKEGETIKVGYTLITLDVKGFKEERKSVSVMGEIHEAGAILPAPKEETISKQVSGVLATPAIRSLAKKKGIDLAKIKGSGPNGRITAQDLEKPAMAIKVTKKYDLYGYVDRIPLKGIRKIIANNMLASYTRIPHVTHMDEADVTELWNLREKEKLAAKKKGAHLTFMPYIIKAVIESLKEHPTLNAELDEASNDIIAKKYYNIGIAVDTENGLMVPVVKGADKKNMIDIAKEIANLAELARTRKIDLADMQGSTFTITNIGSLGGIFATPLINYPESAILALGKISEKPVVLNGKIEIRKTLPFSLTFDHRILDGAEAARFANKFIELLQNPNKLNAKL